MQNRGWKRPARQSGSTPQSPGRYGGTFAHVDIALEFAAWVSVEFKLYLIKEFQRLKEDERKTLDWDVRRNLAKINYRIHTDAIKGNLIPAALTKVQASHVYANEADVLNVALFGMTAKQMQRRRKSQREGKYPRRRERCAVSLPLES